MKLKNQVAMKYLLKMSFLGIDTAFLAMQGRLNSDINIRYASLAKGYRGRYNSAEDPSNQIIRNAVKDLKLVAENILNLPFRSLVSPIGKGGFLKLGENLTNNIKTLDIINYLDNNNLSSNLLGEINLIAGISNFKSQAIASIVFHSINYKNSIIVHPEFDTLDYLFTIDKTISDISEELYPLLNRNYRQSMNFNEVGFYPHPIKNLTIDAMIQIKSWKENSFKQILHECAALPYLLGISEQSISIENPEYPEWLKKSSIHLISSISFRNNVRRKLEMLYNLNFRSIGSLLLLTEKYRTFFKKDISNKLIMHFQD